MQLTIISFVVIFLLVLEDIKAQLRSTSFNDNIDLKSDTIAQSTELYERADWQEIDINFLSSYYEQDGNNSPVTGGIGTERLTDFTQKLTIGVPVSPKLKLNMNAAYDYYSSESTDNIDFVPSSDSSSDIRSQLTIGADYSPDLLKTYGANLGTSVEYDYTSFNAGLSFAQLSESGNSSFSLFGQAFYDTWITYYPRELRRTASVPTKNRQSYNVSLNLAQVVNKRIQVAVSGEVTYMIGLLSTPFHRTYFIEQEIAKIENLPGDRMKIPIGIRMNAHIFERLILRSQYRYYWDSWGMQGHTLTLELPVKLTRFLTVYPQWRYHTQSAVDYFKPFKEHNLDQAFYTSDYDLADLSSTQYGLGILYSPADGIGKMKIPFMKRRHMSLDGIELKYAHYRRSTGLNANIISLGMSFKF